MELILASTSPARRALVQRLGLPFRALDPGLDEAPLQNSERDPVQLTRALARAKARALQAHHQGACIIGADQVVALGEEILGKPLSEERAVLQLARLSGRTHRLVTSTCVLAPSFEETWTEEARLTMPAHEEAVLRRLVARDQPLHCAGSYKLEKSGISLFSRIEAEDWNTIEGLPLLRLACLLRRLGFEL